MKKLAIFVFLIISFGFAHAEPINKTVAELLSKVKTLESRIVLMEAAIASVKAEYWDRDKQYLLFLEDMRCKHNNMVKDVASGSIEFPPFNTKIEVVSGKNCAMTGPAPQLPPSLK